MNNRGPPSSRGCEMQLVFALLAALPVAQAAVQDEAPRTASPPHRRSRSGRIAGSSSSPTGPRRESSCSTWRRSGTACARPSARPASGSRSTARPTTLVSANYRLPVTVGGVQIDCPVTRGYYKNCDPFEDSWGLDKDARLRLWPAGSPWVAPGTFVYPIKQRWFAGATQMANEPSFVDGGDAPAGRPIYYHSGLDIGGCEGLVEVVSACDGLVVSAGGKALPEYPDIPFYKRGDYDYVYVLDVAGVVLPLRAPEVDRPGDPPRGAGQDGPEDRRARQGGLERRLVAPALRHQEPGSRPASGASRRDTPSSGRPTCGSTGRRSSPWRGRTT